MKGTQRTHQEFLAKITSRPLQALGVYTRGCDSISFKCLVDGHVWKARPQDILAGSGCPKCGRKVAGDVQRVTNSFTRVSDYLVVDVSTRSHPQGTMKIGVEDFEYLLGIPIGRIQLSHYGYPATRVAGRSRKVHSLLFPDGMLIDHCSGDKTDNRRDNLRVASRSQNAVNTKLRKDNTSGHVGVALEKGRWRAQIRYENKRRFLGYFKTLDEAVIARDAAEALYFGEFTRPKQLR